MVTIIVIMAITVNEKSPADQMFFHQIFMKVTDLTSGNFADETKALGHLNGPLHAQLHHGRALQLACGTSCLVGERIADYSNQTETLF